MSINNPNKKRIEVLKAEYDSLQKGKESLLVILDEAEIAENVYNSNAIENSTLTLKETEKILLDMEISGGVSVREIFEAKNLARVVGYIRKRAEKINLDKESILLLHQMLIGGIDDNISGRFRTKSEYVKVGTHIAPAPETIEKMIDGILIEYSSKLDEYFLDKIAKFHLDFETIHPFNDGNGRIGRVLINFQLRRLGFPSLIIRDKEKTEYYKSFNEYLGNKKTKIMEKILTFGLLESLHKRITYLSGANIVLLSDYIRKHKLNASKFTNLAKRQTIPAFRERGVWKIRGDFSTLEKTVEMVLNAEKEPTLKGDIRTLAKKLK